MPPPTLAIVFGQIPSYEYHGDKANASDCLIPRFKILETKADASGSLIPRVKIKWNGGFHNARYMPYFFE